jgi:hypothetical protein
MAGPARLLPRVSARPGRPGFARAPRWPHLLPVGGCCRGRRAAAPGAPAPSGVSGPGRGRTGQGRQIWRGARILDAAGRGQLPGGLDPQLPGPPRRYDRAMLGQRWQSQWERVQRRLDDMRAVYTGRPGGTDAAIDAVQSFFEAVHHLKDWLRNDPSSGITKDDVDKLINESLVLRLCADLANGSKHLALTSSRTGDRSTRIARNDVTVFPGTAWGSAAMARRSRQRRPRRGCRRTVSTWPPLALNTTCSGLPKTLPRSGIGSSPAKGSLAEQGSAQ